MDIFKILTPEQQAKADMVSGIHKELNQVIAKHMDLLKEGPADAKDIVCAAITAATLCAGDIIFSSVVTLGEGKDPEEQKRKITEGAAIMAKAAANWGLTRMKYDKPESIN